MMDTSDMNVMGFRVWPVTLGSYTVTDPGPAAWSWVLDGSSWDAGGMSFATQRTVDLSAAVWLLEAVPPTTPLLIYTPSEYVEHVGGRWIRSWAANDWKKADGSPIANGELVRRLWTALEPRRYTRFERVGAATDSTHVHLAGKVAHLTAERVQSNGRVDRVGPGWLPAV